jgi:hypothetical protein
MPLEQFLSIVMTGIFAIEGEIFDETLLMEARVICIAYREF